MNAVQLIGRLTRDPDVRLVTQTQMLVARFSIAVDRKVDKNGEKQADFPSIVCFGKTAELVEKYLGKGRLVGITGRIQTGSYKDKDDKTVYTTDVVADRIEFLDKAPEGEKQAQAPQTAPPPAPVPDAQVSLQDIPSGFSQLNDDDIAF